MSVGNQTAKSLSPNVETTRHVTKSFENHGPVLKFVKCLIKGNRKMLIFVINIRVLSIDIKNAIYTNDGAALKCHVADRKIPFRC
jgi:hypothetical protein